MNIRITEELARLLMDTALHVDLCPSEIVRTVARGVRRGRVVRLQIGDCTTKSGPRVLTVRDAELPEGCTPDLFRAALAERCREALKKPAVRKFQTDLREGVDYTVED